MNKQKRKEQKRLKRKKIVQAKNSAKATKKIAVRQKIKKIKAELRRRMENAVVLTPEQKAQYVAEAKKILKIPEDKEVTFEQIVEAMRMARQRFEEQGLKIETSDAVEPTEEVKKEE